MKIATGVLCCLLLFPVSVIAQSRHSSDWSLDERIAGRLNPALIRERAAARVTRGDITSKRLGEMPSTGVSEIPFVIEGARNAELFLPFELTDSLLRGIADADAVRADHFRQSYKTAIESSGWRADSFWSEFERIASRYLALRQSLIENQASRAPSTANENIRKANSLERQLCAERAVVLRSARQTFGTKSFDRFLYSAVASRLSVTSAQPADADTLRWIEGGCQ